MILGTINWDNVIMDFSSRRDLEPMSQMHSFINIRKNITAEEIRER